MAGRIREDDIALVRERARIDEVVASYVTLRNAGGGSQKGLCPFHDEKTPSFHVTPARNVFYCFGCGEGGDVISFLQMVEGLGFAEAVERLADRCGVQLRYAEGFDAAPRRDGAQRTRLIEANRQASAYYSDQLGSPEAAAAREFLSERGFDQDATATFGVGFSPRAGDALLRHLRQKGFEPDELVAAGLVARNDRGGYDRFRGRLMWPIRDAAGDTLGFGARRLFDDDRIEAKYLNTPETPIYTKSHVLYGIDLARREIARASQAVVVEGYTDVMACHLSGVGTAVATCGTAFGDDHARLLRRLLHDHEEFRGEVVFTFDGDEAGQRAALRAFGGDQQFVGQTYVAVEPDGLDPCDLRLQKGEAAVRELVARRIPMYRFVLGNVVARYDLDRADGRIDALREAARLVSSIRDRSKVDAFARELAGMVGVDVEQAREEVRRAGGRVRGDRRPGRPAAGGSSSSASYSRGEQSLGRPSEPERPAEPPPPDLRDPRFSIERETLKLVVQAPEVVGQAAKDLDPDDFMHPVYRGIWEAVGKCGGAGAASAGAAPAGTTSAGRAAGPGGGGGAWVARLREQVAEEQAGQALNALAVEPLLSNRAPDAAYVAAHVYRLQELTAMRRIVQVKSRLQRTNPVDETAEYNRMFGELVALEQHRRNLRELALGGEG